MNDWRDAILSDLEAVLVRPDGSPAKLLQIFSEILTGTDPMRAETPDELSALHRTAQLLMDMFPGGSDAIYDRLGEMRQVLAMWNLAREEGIPFAADPMSTEDQGELLALREENARLIQECNRLEDALQKAEDALHQPFFAPTRTVSFTGPAEDPEAPPHVHTHDASSPARKAQQPDDPFASIPAHLVTRVDLSTNADIPADAEHLLVTQAARSKKNRVVRCLTFYNLSRLKTVEFDCELHTIESGAFYHQGPLALKFRDPVCVIEPEAFSEKTHITHICAPFSTHPDAIRLYAQAHRIPFIPG